MCIRTKIENSLRDRKLHFSRWGFRTFETFCVMVVYILVVILMFCDSFIFFFVFFSFFIIIFFLTRRRLCVFPEKERNRLIWKDRTFVRETTDNIRSSVCEHIETLHNPTKEKAASPVGHDVLIRKHVVEPVQFLTARNLLRSSSLRTDTHIYI